MTNIGKEYGRFGEPEVREKYLGKQIVASVEDCCVEATLKGLCTNIRYRDGSWIVTTEGGQLTGYDPSVSLLEEM